MHLSRYVVLLSFFSIAFACSVSKKQPSQLINRQWMLTQLPGFTREQLIATQAQLNWQDLPVTLVQAGCYSATYQTRTRNGGRIRFSKLLVKKSSCDTLSYQLESTLTQTLPQVTTYKIEGHFLTLFVNDALVIRAIASDWD